MRILVCIFSAVFFLFGCGGGHRVIDFSYNPVDYPQPIFSITGKRPVLYINPVIDNREFAAIFSGVSHSEKIGRFKEDATLFYQMDDYLLPGPVNTEVRFSESPDITIFEALETELGRFGVKITKDRNLADGVLSSSLEVLENPSYLYHGEINLKIKLQLHQIDFDNPVWTGILIDVRDDANKAKKWGFGASLSRVIKKWYSYPGFTDALVSLADNVTVTSPQPVVRQPSVKQKLVSGGTGFLFSSRDYIITNYHVVKGASSIEVKFPDGEVIKAIVLAKDNQNDIAVLKLSQSPSTQIPDLQFGDSSKVRPGDKVFTIGYPASSILGENQKITDGIVSSITGVEDDPTMFQITVPIQPGNSGGPLFNESGEVIGITTASLSLNAIRSLGAVPQNVNYAIKSSFVNNLLTTIPKTLLSNRGIVVVPNKPGNSLADFFERVSKNIVLIEAKE
jgi:S1-C subfamily serine protease